MVGPSAARASVVWLFCWFSLIALVSVAGCATPLEPWKRSIEVPERAVRVVRPSIDPLPLVVGVHYPDQFRTANKLIHGLSSWAWPFKNSEYPYGIGTVNLLEMAFAGMFETIVPLERWPSSSNVAGVLVPQWLIVDIRAAQQRWYVRASCRVDLYRPSGSMLGSWGASSREREVSNLQLGEGIHSAMTEMVARLALALLDHEDKLREWLSTSQ